MIAAVLALVLMFGVGLPACETDFAGGPLRDTSEAGIRAMKDRSQQVWEAMQQDRDEDPLELVGRWPFGGAFRVRPSWNFANDSIVYMADGSGIRILKASDPNRPQMVGQINCRGSLYGGTENGTGFVSRDTLLYVLYGYTCGLQVFSVANPLQPFEVGDFALTIHPTGIALRDSCAIVVGWDSLLRVIDVANPSNMQQVASLLLPDEALGVDVKGDFAYVACGHAGLVSVDISNPLSPQRRGQVAGFTGIWPVCDTTRGYAYVAGGAGGLHVIDIANPDSLRLVSTLASTPTIDIFKCDTFVYLTGTIVGYQSDLFVVSIANPAQPRLIGSSRADGWSYSACALSPFSYSYTCDGWEGIHVRSLADPGNPVVDTALYGAWGGQDLAIQDSIIYCCSYWAGLSVLSAADPAHPIEIGRCDSANRTPYIGAIALQDSFGFTMWRDGLGNQYFRSLDITDPRNPIPSGTSLTLWEAKAIVLRDTLAYVAENYKFEVYNIARPRQPVRIGRCDLPGVSRDLVVRGNLAYVTPWLEIVDVSDPTQPWLVSSTTGNSGGGIDLLDTFAFCTAPNTLQVYSVASPSSPRLVKSVPTAGLGTDVEVDGSVAYVGSYGIEAFDITSPASPVLVAAYQTPGGVARIRHDSVHVYAACSEGGLCIFDRCTLAVAEGGGAVSATPQRLSPNPTRGIVALTLSRPDVVRAISVRDVAGREVMRQSGDKADRRGSVRLNLSALPDGCYFVGFGDQSGTTSLKVVLSRGR